MSKLAIKAENVGKMYRLGEVGTGTIQQDLQRWYARIRGKEDPFAIVGETNDRTVKGESDFVWALKDVNFEINKGDAVGIIGRNGAGKSTLLKLLSKVTKPTVGNIYVKDRIASLLEVGTGFHPEMTGRENIYLNGAILGMTKKEINRKFDEIVDFAGVARYIDTPVKRYSSGMYVRLAFAVAAHLESEILIVDEVLAVGDAEFQKKCLGKMGDASKQEGRTVLFVSHNMASVKQLCNKGIVMKHGTISIQTSAQEAVNYYLSEGETETSYRHTGTLDTAIGNANIRILKMVVTPYQGKRLTVSSGQVLEVSFYNYKEESNIDCTFEILNQEEVIVTHNGTVISENRDSKKGVYTVRTTIPPFTLNAGRYKINLVFGENQRYELYQKREIIEFEIENETLGSNYFPMPGVLRLDMQFDKKFDSFENYNVD